MARLLDAYRVYLEDAVREALNEAADMVVARAKAKAPVRKLTPQTRGRFTKKSGLNLEVRQFVRANEKFFKQRADFLKFRYAMLHGGAYRTRVQKKTPRKALVLGREVQVIEKPNIKSRGLKGEFLRSNIRPTRRNEFRAGRGVSGAFSRATGTFEPAPEFRHRLSSRGAYEVRRGLKDRPKGQLGAGYLNEATGQIQIGGRLKRSIESEGVVKDGNRYSVRISAAVPYAKYVEFPTRRTAAQPFLLPALKETKRHLPAMVEAALKRRGLKRG